MPRPAYHIFFFYFLHDKTHTTKSVIIGRKKKGEKKVQARNIALKIRENHIKVVSRPGKGKKT